MRVGIEIGLKLGGLHWTHTDIWRLSGIGSRRVEFGGVLRGIFGNLVAMYAASSKLVSSGCLLSSFSSYRRWVHHLAARLPLQQQLLHPSSKSIWVVGVPRPFVGLQAGSVSTLRIAPAQLNARRRLVVALSDDKGNGSTNADGMRSFSFSFSVDIIIEADWRPKLLSQRKFVGNYLLVLENFQTLI